MKHALYVLRGQLAGDQDRCSEDAEGEPDQAGSGFERGVCPKGGKMERGLIATGPDRVADPSESTASPAMSTPRSDYGGRSTAPRSWLPRSAAVPESREAQSG